MGKFFEFDAVIHDANPGAYVLFPYDVKTCFGKAGQVKVACTFDGVAYRGSIADMGAGPCIGVVKSIRMEIGKEAGDRVHVVVEKDEASREVTLTPEFTRALEQNPAAKTVFDGLSYTNQKAYGEWTKAKTTELMRRKIQEAVARLAHGEKKPR